MTVLDRLNKIEAEEKSSGGGVLSRLDAIEAEEGDLFGADVPEWRKALRAFERPGWGGVGQSLEVLATPVRRGVDVINYGLQQVGLGTDEPFMGTGYIPEKMREVTGSVTPQEVPENYRGLARAGEITGQTAPLLLPSGGVLPAASRTATALASEAASMAGSAAAGGTAYQYDPENYWLNLGAEVAGGLTPTSLLIRKADDAGKYLMNLGRRFTRSGQENLAGQFVRRAAEGIEDIEATAKRLQQPAALGELEQLTAGEKASSPTLLAIQNSMAKDLKAVGHKQRLQEMTANTTKAINDAYEAAVKGGDKALIQEIAKRRVQWTQDLTFARIAQANQDAAKAARRVRPGMSPEDASRQAMSKIDDAISDAREAERVIWSEVPQDVPARTDGMVGAYNRMMQDAYEGERALDVTEGFLREATSGPKNSGDLIKLRSRILKRASRARSSMNFDEARELNILADGLLDDLSVVPESELARGYSRGLNDLYTKTDVARLTGVTARGGQRIPPEAALHESIRRPGPRGQVSSRQIEQAAQNVQPRTEGTISYPGASEILGRDVTRRTIPEQTEFLKSELTRMINKETGQINAKSLDNWVESHRALLDQPEFADFRNMLSDTASRQRTAELVTKEATKAQKALEANEVLKRTLGTEDPSRVVGEILGGREPVKQYGDLVSLVRFGNEGDLSSRLNALRRATFDHLFDASRVNGRLSGTAMKEMLDSGLEAQMLRSGVMTPKQQSALRRVINETVRLEEAAKAGANIEDLLPEPNLLEDVLVRMTGARLGASSPIAAGSGATLVAAEAGSRALRERLQKMPMGSVKDVIIEAIENPELMAKIITNSKKAYIQKEAQRHINAFLLRALIEDREHGLASGLEDLGAITIHPGGYNPPQDNMGLLGGS